MFYKKSKIPLTEVNRELIEKWKSTFPEGVFEIGVGDKKAFVRMPTVNEIRQMPKMLKHQKPLQVALWCLKQVWLSGDDDLINDEEYHDAILDSLSDIMMPKVNKVLASQSKHFK